jgi:hypothetical protein
VKPEDVQSFVSRDWEAIQRLKTDIWIEQKASMTPTEVLEHADELRRHARIVKPDWPNAAEREEDLATHIRVAGMLRRAAKQRSH